MRQARPRSGLLKQPSPKRFKKLLLVSPSPASPGAWHCCGGRAGVATPASGRAQAARRFPKTPPEDRRLGAAPRARSATASSAREACGWGEVGTAAGGGREGAGHTGRCGVRAGTSPRPETPGRPSSAQLPARSGPGAGRGGAGLGRDLCRPARPPALFSFFTLNPWVAFLLCTEVALGQPARSQQEPGSRRWRRGREEEATSLPAAGAPSLSALESGRRQRPPRRGRQGRAREPGGCGTGRGGSGGRGTWGPSGWKRGWALGTGGVPTGDRRGRGELSLATGPGRWGRAPPSAAAASAVACAGCSRRPRVPPAGADGAGVPAPRQPLRPRLSPGSCRSSEGAWGARWPAQTSRCRGAPGPPFPRQSPRQRRERRSAPPAPRS